MKKYREMIVLIAEDDDGHAELIKEGLVNAGLCNKIMRFENGVLLLDFLKSTVKEKGIGYLLLLDINMPEMSGTEVLEFIKTHDDYKEMPVIMLTTTDDPREIELCYKLGCNVYITKPVEFVKFSETLKRLGLFLEIVSV